MSVDVYVLIYTHAFFGTRLKAVGLQLWGRKGPIIVYWARTSLPSSEAAELSPRCAFLSP